MTPTTTLLLALWAKAWLVFAKAAVATADCTRNRRRVEVGMEGAFVMGGKSLCTRGDFFQSLNLCRVSVVGIVNELTGKSLPSGELQG
jgi:hypothetical protein